MIPNISINTWYLMAPINNNTKTSLHVTKHVDIGKPAWTILSYVRRRKTPDTMLWAATAWILQAFRATDAEIGYWHSIPLLQAILPEQFGDGSSPQGYIVSAASFVLFFFAIARSLILSWIIMHSSHTFKSLSCNISCSVASWSISTGQHAFISHVKPMNSMCLSDSLWAMWKVIAERL